MALMEKLDSADDEGWHSGRNEVSDQMVASGGIALLCESLLQQGQPEEQTLKVCP